MRPSILILAGELEGKKRSEAFFSAISFNSGLMPNRPDPASSLMLWSVAGSVDFAVVGFIDNPQRAGSFRLKAVLALALELDAQPQFVFRIGVAQAFLVGDLPGLVEFDQCLIERLHAEPVRARHDFLDLRHLAAEYQVRDQRRADQDFHRPAPALGPP